MATTQDLDALMSAFLTRGLPCCSLKVTQHGRTLDELLRAGWDVGVIWQDGRPFNKPDTIRMNLALPLSRVKEAFERLSRYVFCESQG